MYLGPAWPVARGSTRHGTARAREEHGTSRAVLFVSRIPGLRYVLRE